MPRLKKKATTRMNLEMSQVVRDRMTRLGNETDQSFAEVIRKALAVYEFVWSEKKKGASILVRDEHGEREIVII